MEKGSNIIRRLNHFHCKWNVPLEFLVWVYSANNGTIPVKQQ